MAEYFFGEISGEPVGKVYPNRTAAKDAHVHQVTQQGIAGNRRVGCASLVLSGGYSSDEDYGHEIFYTGAGGQDPSDRSIHVAHQDLDKSDNAALVRSQATGLPIRILRGAGHRSVYAPVSGYRYDGLYKVVKYYENYPDDGWRRWMFHLVQLTTDEAATYTPDENYEVDNLAFEELDLGSGFLGGTIPPSESSSAARLDLSHLSPAFPVEVVLPAGDANPGTAIVITHRVVRDSKVTAAVKAMYADTCQVCGVRLQTGAGHYSEGAHIRSLGRPHHGPDTMSNILCLCPNDHAVFDMGGLYLGDELEMFTSTGEHLGRLTVHPDHVIDTNNVRYHRSHHGRVSGFLH
jgi:putative restriction endonuclease